MADPSHVFLAGTHTIVQQPALHPPMPLQVVSLEWDEMETSFLRENGPDRSSLDALLVEVFWG